MSPCQLLDGLRGLGPDPGEAAAYIDGYHAWRKAARLEPRRKDRLRLARMVRDAEQNCGLVCEEWMFE